MTPQITKQMREKYYNEILKEFPRAQNQIDIVESIVSQDDNDDPVVVYKGGIVYSDNYAMSIHTATMKIAITTIDKMLELSHEFMPMDEWVYPIILSYDRFSAIEKPSIKMFVLASMGIKLSASGFGYIQEYDNLYWTFHNIAFGDDLVVRFPIIQSMSDIATGYNKRYAFLHNNINKKDVLFILKTIRMPGSNIRFSIDRRDVVDYWLECESIEDIKNGIESTSQTAISEVCLDGIQYTIEPTISGHTEYDLAIRVEKSYKKYGDLLRRIYENETV